MSSTWMSPRRAVPSGITFVHAHGKTWTHISGLDADSKGWMHTAKLGHTPPISTATLVVLIDDV